MASLLIQVLILVIVVGGLLYILNILPIDVTIKNIGRVVILILAAIYAIGLLAPLVKAQPYAPDFQRDWGRIFGRTDNPDLACNIQRRINRDGDIIWLQMTCRAVGGYRER